MAHPSKTKLTPRTIQAILDTYGALGSIRETGRRLDLHENTVRSYLSRAKGLCSDCPASIASGQRYCAACTARRHAWERVRTQERRRLGVCVECDKRIEPPSIKYCEQHRGDHQRRSAVSAAKGATQRLVCGEGLPPTTWRLTQVRDTDGAAGPAAWEREGGVCTMCGVTHARTAIPLHHLDGDDTHTVTDHRSSLCSRCHTVVHHFLTFPARATLAWLRAHYPHLDLP